MAIVATAHALVDAIEMEMSLRLGLPGTAVDEDDEDAGNTGCDVTCCLEIDSCFVEADAADAADDDDRASHIDMLWMDG